MRSSLYGVWFCQAQLFIFGKGLGDRLNRDGYHNIVDVANGYYDIVISDRYSADSVHEIFQVLSYHGYFGYTEDEHDKKVLELAQKTCRWELMAEYGRVDSRILAGARFEG